MSGLIILILLVVLFCYRGTIMRWLLGSFMKSQMKKMNEFMNAQQQAYNQNANTDQHQGRKGTSAATADAEDVEFEEISDGREPVAASAETIKARDPNSSKTTAAGHVYVEDADYEEIKG